MRLRATAFPPSLPFGGCRRLERLCPVLCLSLSSPLHPAPATSRHSSPGPAPPSASLASPLAAAKRRRQRRPPSPRRPHERARSSCLASRPNKCPTKSIPFSSEGVRAFTCKTKKKTFLLTCGVLLGEGSSRGVRGGRRERSTRLLPPPAADALAACPSSPRRPARPRSSSFPTRRFLAVYTNQRGKMVRLRLARRPRRARR